MTLDAAEEILRVMPENVELQERAVDAFNAGGVDAVLAFFTADVVWVAPPEWIDDEEFVGHAGVRRLAEMWNGNFDNFELELLDVRGAGDLVVAKLMQRGAIKGSGEVVEQRISWVTTFRDGLMCHIRTYFSWEEADAALS